MTSSLLQQGVTLMLIGMGTVFLFLTVLVFAMNLMSRAIAWLPAPAAPALGTATASEEVAAIAAALKMHRQQKGPK